MAWCPPTTAVALPAVFTVIVVPENDKTTASNPVVVLHEHTIAWSVAVLTAI